MHQAQFHVKGWIFGLAVAVGLMSFGQVRSSQAAGLLVPSKSVIEKATPDLGKAVTKARYRSRRGIRIRIHRGYRGYRYRRYYPRYYGYRRYRSYGYYRPYRYRRYYRYRKYRKFRRYRRFRHHRRYRRHW